MCKRASWNWESYARLVQEFNQLYFIIQRQKGNIIGLNGFYLLLTLYAVSISVLHLKDIWFGFSLEIELQIIFSYNYTCCGKTLSERSYLQEIRVTHLSKIFFSIIFFKIFLYFYPVWIRLHQQLIMKGNNVIQLSSFKYFLTLRHLNQHNLIRNSES